MTSHENANKNIDNSTDEESSMLSNVNRKIRTDVGDPEVEALYNKAKKGKLIIQPGFQRRSVWSNAKASQLIESALMGIPLPVVYLAKEKDEKVSVIDGQQRLTSFIRFIDGRYSLTGLKAFKELNNRKFAGIGESHREKILECTIRTITFLEDSDEDLKFDIFERLNSGSVSLNAQELRNCIYRGKYNDLLRTLSGDKDYKKIMNYKEPDKRMRDVENVLRFAAFYFQGYPQYKPPMKDFMNREMYKRRDISSDDAEKLTLAFKKSVSLILSMHESHHFSRFVKGSESSQDGKWEKAFNASLYDILMWSFAQDEYDKHMIMRNLDAIKEAYISIMVSDDEFNDSIFRSTSAIKQVHTRFEKWRIALEKTISNQEKGTRCFSRELKEKLFKENPICAICNNKIAHIDDAAVDHSEQYSMGGKTIPDNARLTHRYCNATRSRKE